MVPLFLKDSKNSFHISIGEDGIVVVQGNNGNVLAKLYSRSTDIHDSAKIVQLFKSDPAADFYIYLDNLDQSYVQRTLPAISPIGINKVAKDRLNKELPNKNYLKSLIQVGRLKTGRKDWIYTFISTHYDKPISTWIEFLSDFENVIAGIYFLPVELCKLVDEIRKKATSEVIENNEVTKNFPVTKINLGSSLQESLLNKILGVKSSNKGQGWDVMVTQNKTGGFRQCAYRNGKVVFSRLLNNVNSPVANVVAGNIEQEIANSVEYLLRLALGNDDFIRIYIIASSEILKGIRKEKLKGTECFLYTPFQISSLLGISNASSEKDKFSDPMMLGLFSKNIFSPKITLHTELTQKVFNLMLSIRLAYRLMQAAIPLLLCIIAFYVYQTYGWSMMISDLGSNLQNIKKQINQKNQIIKDNESKIKEQLPIEHITEIVKLDKNISALSSSPNEFIIKLSEVIPENIRVKSLVWTLKNSEIDKITTTQTGALTVSYDQISKNNSPEITVSTNLTYINKSKSIDDIYRNFSIETTAIRNHFLDYDVSISSLPKTFNFGEISKQIDINASFIKTPNTAKNVKSEISLDSTENSLIEEFKVK